jgi:hypothetical protein
MNDDKFIQFPGFGPAAGKNTSKTSDKSVDKKAAESAPIPGAPGGLSDSIPGNTDGLNEDQRKALQIVLSGMPFVMVGIKPTQSGADFFTALHGEATDLRNAADHLPGVIERAYDRKGI